MPNPQKDFWSQVKKTGSCWLWNGARFDKDGYGKYRYRMKEYRAHKYAWIDTKGPVPSGLVVCHTCDNPPCCNPKHLFLGTSKDNTADMIAKGRQVRTTPPKAQPYKVDEKVMQRIKELRQSGKTQKQIAAEVGLTQAYISKLLRR